MDLHDYIDVAENYDLYVKEIEKDSKTFNEEELISFHLELSNTYGSAGILDVGCGTGVTMLPLLKVGFEVTGLDISQPMIDIVNRKIELLDNSIKTKASTACASMEDFKINRKYSFAFIARTGFMHLLDASSQRRALLNIREHLIDGGILSLNTFYPNHEVIVNQMRSNLDNKFERLTYTNNKGNLEKVFNATMYNPETQIMEGIWTFEEYDDNNNLISMRERPLKLRYTYRKEMEYLFELCGYEILDVYGSYCKEVANYPGWLIWIVKNV